MNNETLQLITSVVKQGRPSSNAVIVRFANDRHASRFLDEFGTAVLAARKPAAPVAAGTIATPIQRYYASPQIGERAIAAEDGELVRYADHLQHTAAAVEARAEELARSFVRDLAAERDKALAELSKLRAATAPVSAVPADERSERANWNTKQWAEHVGAWETAEGFLCFGSWMALSAMLTQFRKETARQAFAAAARASLPPSTGAPVSETFNAMLKDASDIDGNCAPVSGAGQLTVRGEPADPAPVYKWGADGRPTLTNADKMPIYADLRQTQAETAGGQELPAPEAIVAAVHKASATGRVALTVIGPDGIERPTNVAECFVRALAMRQPQGDDSETVSISLDAAEHALAAMKEKYFAGGYNNLYADDRSFVVHSMNELKDGIAAKQVEKE